MTAEAVELIGKKDTRTLKTLRMSAELVVHLAVGQVFRVDETSVPSNATVRQVGYDANTATFVVVLESESFPDVPVGHHLETLKPIAYSAFDCCDPLKRHVGDGGRHPASVIIEAVCADCAEALAKNEALVRDARP